MNNTDTTEYFAGHKQGVADAEAFIATASLIQLTNEHARKVDHWHAGRIGSTTPNHSGYRDGYMATLVDAIYNARTNG